MISLKTSFKNQLLQQCTFRTSSKAFWKAIYLERCRYRQVRALMFPPRPSLGPPRSCRYILPLKYDEAANTLDHSLPHYTFSASTHNRELRELIFWVMEYLMSDMGLQELHAPAGHGRYTPLWDSAIHRWLRPGQWHITGTSTIEVMPALALNPFSFNVNREAPTPSQLDYSWATSTPDSPYWGTELVMQTGSDIAEWTRHMVEAQDCGYSFGGSRNGGSSG